VILSPIAAACIAAAAATYQIPIETLLAIRQVEGGAPGVEHRNQNGSIDLGPFQVNTTWLPSLQAYFGLDDRAATYRLIRDDECASATAAAAILLYEWRAAGRLDAAVAHYNSHNPMHGSVYLGRVSAAQAALMRKAGAK